MTNKLLITIKTLGIILILENALTLPQAKPLVVYAAASTINVIQETSIVFQQKHSIPIHTSFAASGILARQIAQGAPAHIFLSANESWMDDLEQKQLLVSHSRLNLFSNQLVLITPLTQKLTINWSPSFDISQTFQGKFAMGDPHYVPAGKYSKEALSYFHWWEKLKKRSIFAQNVRTALTFVERGEVGMGIVYKTDALISKKVRIIGEVPSQSHPPIHYPIALILKEYNSDKEHPLARTFIRFLQTAEASSIFNKYGFTTQ